LFLRDRVAQANKHLGSAAKDAGVHSGLEFAVFQNAGYEGLYGGFTLATIKRMKGLPRREDLLDRAGHAELAANEFRITQTEQKLRRDAVQGAAAATATHREVGKEVRDTIKRIGGTMPEHLAPEPNIKKIEAQRRKRLRSPAKPPPALE
jgi:DNA-damage-inducible protein D